MSELSKRVLATTVCVAEGSDIALAVALAREVEKLETNAHLGWETARALAIHVGARASERAADEALEALTKGENG